MQNLFLTRAAAMGIAVTEAQAEKVARYHEMLTNVNAVHNLTRIPDTLSEAVDRNYLDSASLLRVNEISTAKSIVDVGSGAGLPGIPLSILLPDTHILLIDSLDKRVKFLNEVISVLHLNAEARHMRAEKAGHDALLREQFDVATARGVASLNLLCEYLLPLVKVGGSVAAMKGPAAQDELDSAQNAIKKLGGNGARIEDAPIPGRDWAHKIVIISKENPTPENFPRREGIPEKRPL